MRSSRRAVSDVSALKTAELSANVFVVAQIAEQEKSVNLAILALRNLRRRPMRSVLVVCSVGLAIGTALTLVALSHSIENGFHEAIDERGADLTVSQRNAGDIFSGFVAENIEARLTAVKGVRGVAGELAMYSPVEKDHQFVVLGWMESSYFWKRMPLRDGRAPVKGERHVVVLGEGAAEALQKKTGDMVELYDGKFRVIALANFVTAFNRNVLILPLADLQELAFRVGQVTAFHLDLAPDMPPPEVDRIRREIEAMGPFLVAPTDQLLRHDQNLAAFNAVARAISLVALTMVGLCVFNALLMAVQERTREIGIMMAIGWSNPRIMASIIVEGIVVGIGGCALGIPIGYAASFLFSSLPAIGNYLSFRPSFALVGPSFLATIVLCALGSLYPAWRATSMTPADALRRA
jgi:putative ABC transport system permease protein